MYERSACVVHAYQVSAHSSAAHAYSKRRGGSPCHRRLREVPSGCVPGHRVRVERRARVLAGRRSFVSIHTRSVVARDPRPDLYRGVRDASQILMVVTTIRGGRGLKFLPHCARPMTVPPDQVCTTKSPPTSWETRPSSSPALDSKASRCPCAPAAAAADGAPVAARSRERNQSVTEISWIARVASNKGAAKRWCTGFALGIRRTDGRKKLETMTR